MSAKLSRREFLVLTEAAGAGLILGWTPVMSAAGTEFKPNALLKIDTSGNVTIWAPKPDMGEGTYTSLPMIIAEELGVEAKDLEKSFALRALGSTESNGYVYFNFWSSGPAADRFRVVMMERRNELRAGAFALRDAEGRFDRRRAPDWNSSRRQRAPLQQRT